MKKRRTVREREKKRRVQSFAHFLLLRFFFSPFVVRYAFENIFFVLFIKVNLFLLSRQKKNFEIK